MQVIMSFSSGSLLNVVFCMTVFSGRSGHKMGTST